MANRDDYRKFDELLNLIQTLCRPTMGLRYEDIEQLMSCSRKTAERIVKFLGQRFKKSFIIENDALDSKVLRFRLLNPDGLPPEYLRSDEIVALSSAIKRIRNEDLQKPLKDLEYKLNRMLMVRKHDTTSDFKNLDDMILSRTNANVPHPHIITDERIIKKIDRAILAFRKIKMAYRYNNGNVVEYIVHPLGFLYGKSNNYLIAYRDDRPQQPRSFILPQIQDVEITGDSFDAGNFDINKYVNDSFGIYHSPDGPFDIEWRADADIADVVMRYIFHPSQQMHKNADGTVTIKFRADGFMEMGLYLFQWGGKIVPIAPAALVDEYRGMLETALKSVS